MNTITRLALMLTQYMVVKKINLNDMEKEVSHVMNGKRDLEGGISGDDAFFSSKEDLHLLKNMGGVLDEVGFPRKDVIPAMLTPISRTIEEIEFCSHHYEQVTFFDTNTNKTITKYMPTRSDRKSVV